MTNSELLRAKINEIGLKLNYLASQLNLTPYGLARKIDNKSEFRASEIDKLCELLKITKLTEKEQIFFAIERDE